MPVLSISYSLDKKNAHKGLCEWYFLKNRIKTVIYCVILDCLAVNFLLSIILLNDSSSVFLLFASVFGICMLFAVPPFQLKSYSEAYGNGENFCLKVYDDKLEITSDSTQTEIAFTEISAVFDTKSFICIETKGKLFPVEKTPKNAEIIKKITQKLKEKLENRYKK